jgi:hypothetical protein
LEKRVTDASVSSDVAKLQNILQKLSTMRTCFHVGAFPRSVHSGATAVHKQTG